MEDDPCGFFLSAMFSVGTCADQSAKRYINSPQRKLWVARH
jgi:hypothetical protein